MTIQEAAQATLDKRWKPIVKAKSIEEIREVIDKSKEYDISDYNCPKSEICLITDLDDAEKISCECERLRFMIAHIDNDLSAALTAAEVVCKRLRGIIRGE